MLTAKQIKSVMNALDDDESHLRELCARAGLPDDITLVALRDLQRPLN